MVSPVIAIHGGAGAISRADLSAVDRERYERALCNVLLAGEAVLAVKGSAIDAVTEAVRLLEECPLFNAGYGAVFTRDETHELDASIMDGGTGNCGAVSSVHTIRNPVKAARAVMESSPHVFFSGAGAEFFAQELGLECVDPNFFSTQARLDQLRQIQTSGGASIVLDHDAGRGYPLDEGSKMGTVGAVALDMAGNLAAATSTGGLTNKWPGRVGDSPIIGAGCYANNATCAVSATGHGEAFIRAVAAYDISALMEYAQLSLVAACSRVVLEKLPRLGGAGGVIAVDTAGRVAMPFNTEGMYRGFQRVGESPCVMIYREDQTARATR